jgi:hypothetical protein
MTTAVKAQPKPKEVPAKVARAAYNPNTVADVYLKTHFGVVMLTGKDANDIRDKIENDKAHSTLDYRFFDDDKRRWAYWAVKDGAGAITPPVFPDPLEYSLTAQQLYTKAVSYVHIFAHAIGLLKEKPKTLWDRMLKPTTIIMAIVGIVFVMGLMLLALQG